MNTIERHRDAFKSLLAPRTEEEKIEQDAMILAAQFISDASDIMVARDMRLKDLAEQIGVSKSYITQIFRGDKLPNFKFMARMQIALGVSFHVSIALPVTETARSQQKSRESV